MTQLQLFRQLPDLSTYDHIIISSSGGKDSQAMLAYVYANAVICGVEDRITVVHADLGKMEWPGTKEIVHAQADHLDAPVVVVSRIGQVATRTSSIYKKG